MVIHSFFLLFTVIYLAGCAGPKPVLYPNTHLQEVGKENADQDVTECEELAEEYASQSNAGEKVAGQTIVGGAVGAASGAVGGAIAGNAGIGAAIGAAVGATQGLIMGLLGANSSDPSPTYKNFVN